MPDPGKHAFDLLGVVFGVKERRCYARLPDFSTNRFAVSGIVTEAGCDVFVLLRTVRRIFVLRALLVNYLRVSTEFEFCFACIYVL